MGLGKIFLIFFVNFILISSLVSAVEISSQGLPSDGLCPRETGLFTHTVRNNNNIVRGYTINVKGSASSWATSFPKEFILVPGEEKNVYTYITPTQSTEPGNYNLEIEATSSGDTNSIKHTITVNNCYSASLIAAPNSATSCPSDVVRYTATLTNNGEYRETFHLSVNGDIASRVSLSDNVVTLNKAESKDIFVFVNAPLESGERSFNVVVESESGKIMEVLPITLNVNPCYDFTLTVQGNNTYSLCDRSYVVIPFRVENNGTTANAYKISVDGPEWARIEATDLTLRDKEARTLNLVFAPNYGDVGNYDARLIITPDMGSLKAVSDFAVNVRKCHSVHTTFVDKKADACKSIVNTYNVSVANDGEVRKTYILDLDAPPWATLNNTDRLLTLEPGTYQNLTITAFPPLDVKEEAYSVKFFAVANDESGVTARDEDQMILNVKNLEDCYKPKIETSYQNLVVYYDSAVAVPINIRNDGIRSAEFNLSLSGNASTFSNLNPNAITVQPNKNETVYLYIAPNANVQLGNYDASVALNLNDGSLLATKNFSIEITNARERATNVVVAGGSTQEQGSIQRISFWSRAKAWFRRVFIGNQTNTNIPVTSGSNQIGSFVPQIETENATNASVAVGGKSLLGLYKYYILGGLLAVLVVILIIHLLFGRKIVAVFSSSKKVKKKASRDSEEIKYNVRF